MSSVMLVKITGLSRSSLSGGHRTIGRNNSSQKRPHKKGETVIGQKKEEAEHSRCLVEPLVWWKQRAALVSAHRWTCVFHRTLLYAVRGSIQNGTFLALMSIKFSAIYVCTTIGPQVFWLFPSACNIRHTFWSNISAWQIRHKIHWKMSA